MENGKKKPLPSWNLHRNNKKIGKASLVFKDKGNYMGCTTRTFKILPGKAVISSLKAGKRSFTVKFKKQGGGVSYQIFYRNKNSNELYKGGVRTGNRSKVIKGLKKGGTYSVMVCAYKKAGGKTYYGNYSSVKNIKVK